jgi:hypothetical protein
MFQHKPKPYIKKTIVMNCKKTNKTEAVVACLKSNVKVNLSLFLLKFTAIGYGLNNWGRSSSPGSQQFSLLNVIQ